LRARLKAFAGHIWPAGRMLCMPALNNPDPDGYQFLFTEKNV
jgi:hypothetical protein